MSAEYSSAGIITRQTIEPVTIKGANVLDLPEAWRGQIAGEISDWVAKFSQFMGSISPAEILEEMGNGNFALLVDHPTNPTVFHSGARVAGLLEKPGDLDIQQPEKTMVIGTWVSPKGYGPRALIETADLAVSEKGAKAAVALVNKANRRGLEKALAAGGKVVGERRSGKVMGPDMQGAPVLVVKLR